MKKLLVSAALALAAVAGAHPAAAQDEYPIYTYVFYSDASYSNQVGVMHGSCGRWGAQYTLSGSQSAYREEFEIGLCRDGVLVPY